MKDVSFTPPSVLCAYPPDTAMLLALSGGADSRLLLHLCAEVAHKTGAVLRLCHVHHGIRGTEADRDEAFCRALAAEYGLPIDVLRADVPALAKESGESLETAARRVRYDFFASLMREHRIPMLLTAHHATDNAETVLFRMVRGTSLKGLCGIPPVRPFAAAEQADLPHPPAIVRPLLTWTRADVLEACERLGLAFVADSTNADTAYARNRIRADVLPSLEHLVSRPEDAITRLCASLREDEQLLCSLSAELLASARRDDALCRDKLASAHPALAKRALCAWLSQMGAESPETVHLEALLALCAKSATGQRCSIGGGTVLAEGDLLCFLPDTCAQDAPAVPFCLPLLEGEQADERTGIRASLIPLDEHAAVTINSNDGENVYNPFIRDTLTFDIIIPYDADRPLWLRSREDGDRILLRGMHRKIRKLQNERGIPAHWRTRLPLLCDGEDVLWAPGIGLRDGAIQTSGQSARLVLTVTRQKH